MKLLSLFILFGLSTAPCFSQQVEARNETPSGSISLNIDRYNLDYELIGYTFINGDSTILNELDISGMIEIRDALDDIELTDLEHGVTILIYSTNKSLELRGIDKRESGKSKRRD